MLEVTRLITREGGTWCQTVPVPPTSHGPPVSLSMGVPILVHAPTLPCALCLGTC